MAHVPVKRVTWFGLAITTAVLGVGALVFVSACSIEPAHETSCYPGDFQWCLCADGARGLQQCDTDAGSGYGACVCNAAGADARSDAASESASDAAACAMSGNSDLCIYAACTSSAQCAPYQGKTAQCYGFNAKGPHCTIGCAIDGDCPPPSTGCSNMKVCKEP